MVVEDGDSRQPDLVISGRLPDIVHFATVPTLKGRLHGVPDPRQPRGRRALSRIASGRVRIEGDRVLGRRLLGEGSLARRLAAAAAISAGIICIAVG